MYTYFSSLRRAIGSESLRRRFVCRLHSRQRRAYTFDVLRPARHVGIRNCVPYTMTTMMKKKKKYRLSSLIFCCSKRKTYVYSFKVFEFDRTSRYNINACSTQIVRIRRRARIKCMVVKGLEISTGNFHRIIESRTLDASSISDSRYTRVVYNTRVA